MQKSQQEFNGARGAVTRDDHTGALIGLTKFIKYIHILRGEGTSFGEIHPESFCYQSDTFFSEVSDFLMGKFRQDGGLAHLEQAFTCLMREHPSNAERYFYSFAQLSQLLLCVHSAEELIHKHAGAYSNLKDESEYFYPERYKSMIL